MNRQAVLRRLLSLWSYRTCIMVLGIALASGGFTVLTSQSEASRLQVTGTVEANSRGSYDILVRPPGTRVPSEAENGVVQAGFLSGIRGGISMDQWRVVQGIPGVEVAAPMAMVGTVVKELEVQLPDYPNLSTETGYVGTRLDVSFSTDSGLSTIKADPIILAAGPKWVDSRDCRPRMIYQQSSRTLGKPDVFCVNRVGRSDESWKAWEAARVWVPVPLVLAAIDPESEAKLTGLDSAVIEGHYLEPGRVAKVKGRGSSDVTTAELDQLPLLVSSRPWHQLDTTYKFTRLDAAAVEEAVASQAVAKLSTAPGQLLMEGALDAEQSQRLFLDQIKPETQYFTKDNRFDEDVWSRVIGMVYQPGLANVQQHAGGNALVAADVHETRDMWRNSAPDRLDIRTPPGADGDAVRPVTGLFNAGRGSQPPAYLPVGTFDPSRVEGHSYGDLSAAKTLDPLSLTTVTGADAESTALLGGGPLVPGYSIGGYAQSPPTALTTLDALNALGGSGWFRIDDPVAVGGGNTRDIPYPRQEPVRNNSPLSIIRVRVDGVTGVDEVSRERVRLVAEQIGQETGLVVDIVTGASPTGQEISLPAGTYGRPGLRVSEAWTKKGVALAVLDAVDMKSVALFVLILTVCVFFVLNLLLASVRARRSELAIRQCLGWTRGSIACRVATQTAMTALGAGCLGVVVALFLGQIIGAEVSAEHALLAMPVAIAVAVPAGAVGAWAAVRVAPMEAVAAPVRVGAVRRLSNLWSLALANVQRDTWRSVLAVAGVAVAAAAAVVVLVVVIAFRGAVVGSLLGDAVSVQVRGADIAAVVGVSMLAAVGVANVAFLNIRERGNELALFQAVGWSHRTVTGLLVREGVVHGAIGGIVGAILGFGIMTVLTSEFNVKVVAVASGVVVASTLVCLVSTLVPAATIARLPVAQLLTEE